MPCGTGPQVNSALDIAEMLAQKDIGVLLWFGCDALQGSASNSRTVRLAGCESHTVELLSQAEKRRPRSYAAMF